MLCMGLLIPLTMILFGWGIVLVPISIMAMILVFGKDIDTIGPWGGIVCFIQIVPMLGAILLTERELKGNFDEKGNRR